MDPISIREKWFGRLEQVRTERLSGGVPLLYFPDPEWTDLPELYSECGRPFATTVGDARTRLAVYKRVLRRERGLLLFGMAAAAYEAGTGNRLWPEVRKRFLAAYPRSTITLAQFQALAAIFTECWEAEVRDSRGRLFVPRQGLRNIKWPLSHAGLKPAEREDLVEFAQAVASQFGADGLQSFLDADTQEFTMMLKDWLRAGTGHIGARLRELIEDVRFPIVAELGRAFLLRRGVASFRDRAVVGQVVPDSTAQLIRRQLVFDADARQLRIRLSGGNFPNTGPLTMNWEGSEHRLHARTANVGSRLARRLDTDVVVAKIWKRDDARIMYTGGSSLVTLPPSPDKSAFLWFSESSGLQSRTWQEGQVYSAVRNPDRPSTWPALLFSTKHPWRPLELLGAKLEFGHVTARPLAEIMREVGDLGVLLGRLEAEGAEIDFGSLRSGSEPHATLTSGMPVEYLGNEAILVEEPPIVEIRGDWTGSLSVTVRSETLTDTVTVTKPSDGVALLTLVDPRPGTLEVTVRDRRLPIQLLGGWPRPTKPPAILSVRRTVVGDTTVIDGQAWPGADITVVPLSGGPLLARATAGPDGLLTIVLDRSTTTVALAVVADGVEVAVFDSSRIHVEEATVIGKVLRISLSQPFDAPHGLEYIVVGPSPAEMAVFGSPPLEKHHRLAVPVESPKYVSAALVFARSKQGAPEFLFAASVAPVRRLLTVRDLITRGFWEPWLPYARAAKGQLLPESAAAVVAVAEAGAVIYNYRGLSSTACAPILESIELLVDAAVGGQLDDTQRTIIDELVSAHYREGAGTEASRWIREVTATASHILLAREGADANMDALTFAREVERRTVSLSAVRQFLPTIQAQSRSSAASDEAKSGRPPAGPPPTAAPPWVASLNLTSKGDLTAFELALKKALGDLT